MRVVALEEHFNVPSLVRRIAPDAIARFGFPSGFGDPLADKLADLGALRLGEMDEAGITVHVLSASGPGANLLHGAEGIAFARDINDVLAKAVAAHPDRFAGFAHLPMNSPEAAADEIERSVRDLGFCGVLINGVTEGRFLDDPRFEPILARAEALDVPIYLHPSMPHPAVIDVYYKEYAKDFPVLLRAAWGYTVETATLAIRLVLSGLFEQHKTKFILGHLGEGLPFLLWRINNGLARPGQKPVQFRDIFSAHFSITTSGFFSDPALLLCVQEMGIDRILFAVDYPFEANAPGPAWLARVPHCDEDKGKIASGNAKRLLRM
jgi:predicted TIM-barrel fold metal-dependent hydrolase